MDHRAEQRLAQELADHVCPSCTARGSVQPIIPGATKLAIDPKATHICECGAEHWVDDYDPERPTDIECLSPCRDCGQFCWESEHGCPIDAAWLAANLGPNTGRAVIA